MNLLDEYANLEEELNDYEFAPADFFIIEKLK
jgi:hypothetical protein